MDYLKEGIGLRAYGHRDPIVEYQHEAFSMFSEMVSSIKEEIVETIFKVQALHAERVKGVFSSLPRQFIHPQMARFRKEEPMPAEQPSLQRTPPQVQFRSSRKIGRNQPCPCGSGKKYKKCCGR
jgi:preprotein translocase subunit SecA